MNRPGGGMVDTLVSNTSVFADMSVRVRPWVQKAERVNRARAMETNSAFFFALLTHTRSS